VGGWVGLRSGLVMSCRNNLTFVHDNRPNGNLVCMPCINREVKCVRHKKSFVFIKNRGVELWEWACVHNNSDAWLNYILKDGIVLGLYDRFHPV